MARTPLHERLPAADSSEFEEQAEALFRTLCTLIVAKRDVDEALLALVELDHHKPEPRSPLHRALYRAAVIAYARPFIAKGTDGLNRLKKKHYVPEERQDFHTELLDHRDDVVAHSPTTHSDPSIILFAESGPSDQPTKFILTFGHTEVDMTPAHIDTMRELCLEVSELIEADRTALQDLFEANPAITRKYIREAVPMFPGSLIDTESSILPPLP